MKSLLQTVALAVVLAAPMVSQAQSGGAPLTRAQVRADLIDVENAGYRPPVGLDPHYPEDIQAAEQRVDVQREASRANQAGFGGDANGTSASGRRADVAVSPYSPPVRAVQ